MNKTSGADDRRHGSDDRKCSDNSRDRELFAINLFFIFFLLSFFLFFFFFQYFVSADFYFLADMFGIRRYIRYSSVFRAVRNKGVSVLVDRSVR